jgi:hypothetical protein
MRAGLEEFAMYRLLLGFSLLAASAAAFAQNRSADNHPSADNRDSSPWGLARAPGSCMLHASTEQGSVVSIWGFAGQSKIGFLIQNKDWSALREGQRYDLKVDFPGVRAWPVRATGRQDLDSDGPGYFFTVEPGDRSGSGFLDALASAKNMAISRDGAAMDSLPLAGSREAVSALARCMAELWAESPDSGELEKQVSTPPVIPTT